MFYTLTVHLPKTFALVRVQMEGMVLDLQTARELQQLYEDWKEAQTQKIGLDINVTVLTIGNWPTYKVRLTRECYPLVIHM